MSEHLLRRQARFASREAVIEYVQAQAAEALPTGWQLEPVEPPSTSFEDEFDIRPQELVWRIVPPDRGPRDFIVRVSEDLESFIILHGNSTAGPFALHHVLLNAMVIERRYLGMFPLSPAIRHVVEHCKPNEWDLT